jgi:hypothetical protein
MLERVVKIMFTIIWLPPSKYDLNDRPRFLKLSHSQCEGDFNTIVIASGNFKRQTGWTELNQFQLEMSNVLIIVRLDVALAAVEKLKLTLNHQVRCGLLERVDSPFIAILGIKEDLAVITASNGRNCFGVKVHDGSPSALTNSVYPPPRKRKNKTREVAAADKRCWTEPPSQAVTMGIVSQPVAALAKNRRQGNAEAAHLPVKRRNMPASG